MMPFEQTVRAEAPLNLKTKLPPEQEVGSTQQKNNLRNVKEKKEAEDARASAQAYLRPVDVTTISILPEQVAAPSFSAVAFDGVTRFFGWKIDLKSKVESLKESYKKEYAQMSSDNLMVSLFAKGKAAMVGATLWLLGVPRGEIEALQKEAKESAFRQNAALYEENEYNRMILENMGGGGKKQRRAQERVINDIAKKLEIQMRNLGHPEHYRAQSRLAIQITQLERIREKFVSERDQLCYTAEYLRGEVSVPKAAGL